MTTLARLRELHQQASNTRGPIIIRTQTREDCEAGQQYIDAVNAALPALLTIAQTAQDVLDVVDDSGARHELNRLRDALATLNQP